MPAWLTHLESLGANGLLLGPVFTSLSHGYDTITHREIDARIGNRDDMDALVAAAAEHEVGVILDGVFAFASREFHRLTDPTSHVPHGFYATPQVSSSRGRSTYW